MVNLCAGHVARHQHDGKVVLVTLALAAIFTYLGGGLELCTVLQVGVWLEEGCFDDVAA